MAIVAAIGPGSTRPWRRLAEAALNEYPAFGRVAINENEKISEIMKFAPQNHVENRRLFAAAAGSQRLEEWERQHVHACEVCQGVFYVFIRQMMTRSQAPSKDTPPAA